MRAMRMGMGRQWALIGSVVLWSTAALAVDPAIKCEADKLKAAGKYAMCRMQVQAKAVRAFATPDFSKCDAQFETQWQQLETRALEQGTSCWTMGDAQAIQTETAAHTDAVATALAP